MAEYVLKIGGSVLTDKREERKLSEDFEGILKKVSRHPEGILIHGAGSYGHPPADRYDLKEGTKEGAVEIHSAIKQLNDKVIEQLREQDVEAVPVHPFSASYRDQETHMMTKQVLMMVKEDFTPVLHGDAMVTQGKGTTPVSGDEILPIIESEAQTGHVGFCTSRPGVLDENGEVMDEIESMKDFHRHETEGIDVTGGMKNKLEKIFEKNIDARIFGVEDLENFLEGEEVGTLVRGR